MLKIAKAQEQPENKQVIDDSQVESKDIEIKLLVEAIYLKYGYDFRNYAMASLKRRINHRLKLANFNNVSEMQHMALHDVAFFETLLLDLSINVTEMFRDPYVYLEIRKKVIPELRNLPFVKIWHAGCATGEEVYSMAILLKEEGLYERSQIYATDFNQVVLEKAKSGIFPIDRIKEYTSNYQAAGGTGSFSDYYHANFGSAVMDRTLKKNIVFADHNLVTDWVFSEMNMIFCRNVLIYFDKDLQNKVIKLFIDSLSEGGFLCLGNKENTSCLKYANYFEDVAANEKIYRLKKDANLVLK